MKAIILFKTSTCVPCKHFEPVFDEITSHFKGNVYKVVDDLDLMASMGIRNVPCVVLAEETAPGEFVPDHRFAGPQLRKVILEEAIEAYTGK